MPRRRINTTKLEVIQVACEMFLTNGYSHTSTKKIGEELDMSSGHIMFYFPTKEHLLAVLVEMLCDFQWKMMRNVVNEGNTSLLAVCSELAIMAAMCENDEVAKDLYLSIYSHPLTLDIIRRNDAKRAKLVFSEYCPDWDDQRYTEAEIIVSGIEYATLMTTGDLVPLDNRVAGAINSILKTYNVPEDIRNQKIDKVLAMDYRQFGKSVLKEFKQYVEETNEQAFETVWQKHLEGRV